MINLKKIQDAEVKGKTIFLRADLDVPIQNGKITDGMRLNAWFPTLENLARNGAQVVIAGHLGRPKNEDLSLSLLPIAEWIAKKINSKPQKTKMGDFDGWKLTENVSFLENLRFNSGEEINDNEFSEKLSRIAQIYVNDAFASSHRKHASIVGITQFLPSYAGLRLQKEVEELSKVLENPQRPLTIIVGGAKIETKLPLVEKMHQVADFVLVGGEIAEHVKELAKVEHEKIQNRKSELLVADLTADNEDIDENSTQKFIDVINKSKTIVWNGPMGEFEKGFNIGTKEIANAISASNAYTIAGGGDTVAFLEKEGLIDKFSFVSVGGGAMLEFLSGDKLPGLEALLV